MTSCGLADAAWMARGIPAPSATAISFVPLPRLVFPILEPLFSPPQRSRRYNIPRDRISLVFGDRLRGLPVFFSIPQPGPIPGIFGGKSDTEDNVPVNRTIGLLNEESKESRS